MSDRPTPTEVAKLISRMANTFSGDDLNELAQLLAQDHRTLQQNIMRDLVHPLLKIWAEGAASGCFDLRNEQTVKVARAMVDATADVAYFPTV